MTERIPRHRSLRKKSIIKAIGLTVFLVVAFLAVRFTPAKELLDQERLGTILEPQGFVAPLVFILIYAAGICLFVPGTILTALGGAIFGPYWGFVYVWVGAMLGATAAFWIGRTLGREFTASLIGDRLRKYDDAIERKGFATVLYLRLIYFPFTAMNFGMGLTKVRFWDYFFGTALGILVGTFVFTFFIGTMKEVWRGGDWGQLISFKVFISVGLFVFSLFMPKLVKSLKKQG
jgi:uncharacterized membrane protein YdjX (TVP38/TMEM64 family)